jgi:hypothetical protein
VNRYRFFLFNVNSVDMTELRVALRMRTTYVEPTGDLYEERVRAEMTRMGHRDSRRLVAEHQSPPVASLMNQMRLGFFPKGLELTNLVQSTFAACLAQANTRAHSGGPTAAAETREFITSAGLLLEMIHDLGSPDAALQKDLQSFILQTEQSPVPYVHELTQGQHTVDLAPIKDPEEADVE